VAKGKGKVIEAQQWSVEQDIASQGFDYVRGAGYLTVFYQGRYANFPVRVIPQSANGVLYYVGDIAPLATVQKDKNRQMLLQNALNSRRGRISYFFETIGRKTTFASTVSLSGIETSERGLVIGALHNFIVDVEEAMYKFALLGAVTRNGEKLSPQQVLDEDLPDFFGWA
jgi:hypothetical protein